MTRKETDIEDNKNILFGRNTVREALKSKRGVSKILIRKGSRGTTMNDIASEARKKRVAVQFVDKAKLDRLSRGGSHQGILALVDEFEYSDIEDILKHAEAKAQKPFIVILDGIEDPHNLGAILRTAECSGVHGVIISQRRAVGINSTVEKTSAGACQYVKVARVKNLTRTIESLKNKGIWIACCDMDGRIYYESDLTVPVAIVIGNEGAGVSRLVKEACDFTVSISMRGNIESLNASNAAAVLMYEVIRQRS